jgi:Rubrerythrin
MSRAIDNYELFRRYEGQTWKIRDLPWDRLDPGKVKPEYVRLARSAIMGECNSIAAQHGFLNESTSDYEFGAFAALWGYEELRHHYAFRAWLEQLGLSTADLPVADSRPPYPPGRTFVATLATNIISELTVFRVYRDLSEDVEEPVLAEIMLRASEDEARHASAFTDFARNRLRQHPEELGSLLETLYFYVADPDKTIKHPVSVFKDELGAGGNETIDDGFGYFLARRETAEGLRTKIYSVFSALSSFELDSPRSVRRSLAQVLSA